jgi:hypothetical protein
MTDELSEASVVTLGYKVKKLAPYLCHLMTFNIRKVLIVESQNSIEFPFVFGDPSQQYFSYYFVDSILFLLNFILQH